jgi:hypothetical protein
VTFDLAELRGEGILLLPHQALAGKDDDMVADEGPPDTVAVAAGERTGEVEAGDLDARRG